MKISKVIEILYNFKAWKIGKVPECPEDRDLIKAVGTAINELKSWQVAKVKIQKNAENADKKKQKENGHDKEGVYIRTDYGDQGCPKPV